MAFKSQAASWIATGAVGLVLVGCAGVGAVVSSPEAVVKARAQERWDSMMKGDVEKAYEYLSPASRETLSKQNYLRRRAGGRYWRSVTIPKVECAADLCKVSIELVYDLSPDLKGLKREFVETWILDGGTWWLVQDK